MKPILTVFTPTYNRKELIYKCYESLRRQTNKNFKWLVIDDGSTDDTKELIINWKEEADFLIDYIYKKNGGMHSAHNTAYENIDTELNICIDSDGIKGDKKLIYRTELTKKYPYPEFEDEKYVGLAYKCHKLDEKYKLALVNEPVCIVEYMEDGSTKNMLRQYRNNPKGWCFYRIENLKIPNTSLIYKFKECIHYVSSSLIVKDKNFFSKVPYKGIMLAAIPLGYILYSYIIFRTRDIRNL